MRSYAGIKRQPIEMSGKAVEGLCSAVDSKTNVDDDDQLFPVFCGI